MNLYVPDTWAVLKLTNTTQPGYEEVIYKVLGGWGGSYLNGTSWRLNSGVVRMQMDEEHYMFYGYSGSCYKCHKDSYKLSMSAIGVYNELKRKFGERVQLMDKYTDWGKKLW